MIRIPTALPEVCELRPSVNRDSRGFFLESYHREKLAELGITDVFVQDNQSCSKKDVLRGLHYQLRRPQAKLCRVVEGAALDVIVDIRVGSPRFGEWTNVMLSTGDHNQVYIPKGFAHGFLALTDDVQFLYKCSDFYDPGENLGVLWNDPLLGIEWGIAAPLLSEKDRQYPPLSQIPRDLLPRYSLSRS